MSEVLSAEFKKRLRAGKPKLGVFVNSFISLGNDLHHMLTQTGPCVNDVEKLARDKGESRTRRPTALF